MLISQVTKIQRRVNWVQGGRLDHYTKPMLTRIHMRCTGNTNNSCRFIIHDHDLFTMVSIKDKEHIIERLEGIEERLDNK